MGTNDFRNFIISTAIRLACTTCGIQLDVSANIGSITESEFTPEQK